VTSTATLEKVDRKLRHLRAVESTYRKTVKRAQEEFRNETVDTEKAERRYKKTKAKYARKIEKLQPKIQSLIHQRAELKG
jgi:hypothetical protein